MCQKCTHFQYDKCLETQPWGNRGRLRSPGMVHNSTATSNIQHCGASCVGINRQPRGGEVAPVGGQCGI
jgi:hypothetical protein